MQYYFDYAYSNPTVRAQDIGYVQELLARLQHEYITFSSSSVNSTIDNNAAEFLPGQAFYADFNHDDIIISVLTTLFFDFFHKPPKPNLSPTRSQPSIYSLQSNALRSTTRHRSYRLCLR